MPEPKDQAPIGESAALCFLLCDFSREGSSTEIGQEVPR